MKLIDAIKSTDIDTVRRIVSESGIEAVNERDKVSITTTLIVRRDSLLFFR